MGNIKNHALSYSHPFLLKLSLILFNPNSIGVKSSLIVLEGEGCKIGDVSVLTFVFFLNETLGICYD